MHQDWLDEAQIQAASFFGPSQVCRCLNPYPEPKGMYGKCPTRIPCPSCSFPLWWDFEQHKDRWRELKRRLCPAIASDAQRERRQDPETHPGALPGPFGVCPPESHVPKRFYLPWKPALINNYFIAPDQSIYTLQQSLGSGWQSLGSAGTPPLQVCQARGAGSSPQPRAACAASPMRASWVWGSSELS